MSGIGSHSREPSLKDVYRSNETEFDFTLHFCL